jgi:peptidoglycan-N-acetylglucosamine deacetylase
MRWILCKTLVIVLLWPENVSEAMSYLQKIGDIKDRLVRTYVSWRIKTTKEEFHSYNHTDRILLTFDDYADEATVAQFLDVLRRENVRAAFFLMGRWAQQNPEAVKSVRMAGHWVGNHTYSHRILTKLSSAEVELEIRNGVKGKLLRPPKGAYNDRIRKIAAQAGYRIAFWTIDSLDWKGITAAQIQERVLDGLHPGACVLLHLKYPHTLEALPGLIQEIRERGFELCNDGSEISP